MNLGYFYDRGIGVRANQKKALYWYRRAHRRGDASGANNIATLFRDHGPVSKAIAWFKRAISDGADDAALELGKLYMTLNKPQEAKFFLRQAARSRRVSEDTQEKAQRLLKRLS